MLLLYPSYEDGKNAVGVSQSFGSFFEASFVDYYYTSFKQKIETKELSPILRGGGA
ncbi:hypothetical protein [Campylobacter sp. MIT 99-7217]|uniref:hypothetical protein n=1 Tax=Campylobacter sp. MIT 99-7217 TaxID=535091 RepID=UPI00163BA119|nr:hypothetical protein [Campylobacter sp. MIT 99-7217]